MNANRDRPVRGDVPANLQAPLGDRYEIQREIGRGGMGAVYLAEDTKHDRVVAVKVLRPELAATLGADRFLREIQITAHLNHPHILPLLDSGSTDDLLYYVMPYVDGESLRHRLAREGRLPIDEAVQTAIEVARALQYAHEAGVVHRDIKPENILLHRGEAMLADFGIAFALTGEGARLTKTSDSLGTPLYVSPEQATNDRAGVGPPSDLYSLGAVLFEMLTGEAPFTGATVPAIIARALTERVPHPRAVRDEIPPALDKAVVRALEKDPKDRFPDVERFAEALGKVPKQSQLALAHHSRKIRLAAGAVSGLLVVALAAWGFSVRAEARSTLRAAEALRDIERLAAAREFAAAFKVASAIEPILPNDSALSRLWNQIAFSSAIRSVPSGARVSYRETDDPSAPWQPIGTTPLEGVRFPRLFPYYLRVERDGFHPVEILSSALPGNDGRVRVFDPITLDPIGSSPAEMVRVPGFTYPAEGGPESIAYGDFLIDRFEVSNQEFARFIDAGGYETPDYWADALKEAPPGKALAELLPELVDQTGRPGPSTWRLGTYPEGQADYPVGGVSWYEAAAYAQFVGKEVPTVQHWRAAYQMPYWTSYARIVVAADSPQPVGARRAMSSYGAFDLAGNVREWCFNAVGVQRATIGAAWSDPQYQIGNIIPKNAVDRDPTNGIRLIRHLGDATKLRPLRLPATVQEPRDYSGAAPASDAEYQIYRRVFDYDPMPLSAVTVKTDTAEYWIREKVEFDAPYGQARGGAYLWVPRRGNRPLQAVIYWPGSGAVNAASIDQWQTSVFDFMVRSGRAVAMPLFEGTFERDDADLSIRYGPLVTNGEGSAYREIAAHWVMDARRTVDYLLSRPVDFATTRIGFYGHSWGGYVAPLLLATEPRIKAAVINVGGLAPFYRFSPEVDPLNYVSRVSTPLLLLSGEFDNRFPLEQSQRPFFRLLGTPEADKRHVTYPTAHYVPQNQLIRETLTWLDRYLGGPQD